MRKLVLALMILSVIFLAGCVNQKQTVFEPKTIYVDIHGKGDYKSIQSAIDAARDGDTIVVSNGSYHESIRIYKSLKLFSKGNVTLYGEEDSIKSFILYHQREGYVVLVSADNCTIDGFNIINKVRILNVEGIRVNSSRNKIINNTIKSAYYGIQLWRNSDNNNVINNTITSCDFCGLYIYRSNRNFVSGNKIFGNFHGMRIKGSSNNTVYGNKISNNTYGLELCCGADFNTIYFNSFINNTEKNAHDYLINNWDNGKVGNYWSDYQDKYPSANQENGIWDTPYSIDGGENFDRYPLVSPPMV